MTAWWVSTTRVRKVRARSSERFRDLALGTAPTSACPTAEIEVMRAPPGRAVCAECCRREPDSASLMTQRAAMRQILWIRLSAHFLDLHLVRIEGQVAGDLGHRRERCFIGPDRIFEGLAVRVDAEITRIPLVGAVRGAVGTRQKRHVGVLAL